MSSTEAANETNVWQQLKEEIKRQAPAMGIDKVGFASADPFLDLKEILLSRREKGYESGFEEPDIDKRIYPKLNHPEPRSIISIAVSYPYRMSRNPRSRPGAYRGTISRSAWGKDYHRVLKDRLNRLEEWIRSHVPDALIVSMVDTGALVDRAVAERAGIGWSAKNCSIITPEWGSWVFLGEMITNIPFPPDTPVTEECGDCTLCIDACPTGALVGPGQLDASRCLSFVTQTKGWVEDDLREKMGNRLYGCDTCQMVCPKNRGKNWTHQPEFAPDPERARPLLKPLLKISNREFKEKFGESAASWRGKKPIQRNAIIALGNFKDQTAVDPLIEVMENDPRPVMRGTAAWALSKIGGEKAKRALVRAAKTEENAEVLEELQKALVRLEEGKA